MSDAKRLDLSKSQDSPWLGSGVAHLGSLQRQAYLCKFEVSLVYS